MAIHGVDGACPRSEHDELVRLLRWEQERAEHYRWIAALQGRLGNWLMLAGAAWGELLTVAFRWGHPHFWALAILVFFAWWTIFWVVSGAITYSGKRLEGVPSARVADYIDRNTRTEGEG